MKQDEAKKKCKVYFNLSSQIFLIAPSQSEKTVVSSLFELGSAECGHSYEPPFSTSPFSIAVSRL
jgi:hypothetical protein